MGLESGDQRRADSSACFMLSKVHFSVCQEWFGKAWCGELGRLGRFWQARRVPVRIVVMR